MSDKNIDGINSGEQIMDAVTGLKRKAQGPPLSSIPVHIKLGIQRMKAEIGLKNDGEAVEILVAALLGHFPAVADGETEDAAADKIGEQLARLASIERAKDTLEADREERKLAAEEKKAQAAAAERAARKAAIDARKAALG